MKHFKHSGKVGDVIFSLPAMRELGGGVLRLPERTHECPALYSNMRELLLQQPFIHDVVEYPSMLPYGVLAEGVHIDIDLDRHREHNLRGLVNMVQRYFDVFNIKGVDYTLPWLIVEGPRRIDHDYNLISLTSRFRDNSRVNWKRVYEQIPKPVYFLGTEVEHDQFVEKISPIERICTADLLTFALYIKYCTTLFCNQSAALSIAQSLGKTYHCEFKPRKTNCYFYTPNEYQII